jgi:hypothetical protein
MRGFLSVCERDFVCGWSGGTLEAGRPTVSRAIRLETDAGSFDASGEHSYALSALLPTHYRSVFPAGARGRSLSRILLWRASVMKSQGRWCKNGRRLVTTGQSYRSTTPKLKRPMSAFNPPKREKGATRTTTTQTLTTVRIITRTSARLRLTLLRLIHKFRSQPIFTI